MATQSLYRRYRPRRFSELKGQDHVVMALRDAVATGREGQAYLFSGPRGTGKTTSARILAKVLNCDNVIDGEPCCECESCLSVERGTSYDVHELDAASNNGVDSIRDLVEKAALGSPGRHKVYILDEVHMLSKAAEAALLKTLEEPPPHVVFVLATTDPQKMSDTIRSRTQHLQFHLLPSDTMAEHVRWVAGDAGLELSDVALDAALTQGGGSARDTLSALELLASTGGDVSDVVDLDEFLIGLIERDSGRVLTAMGYAVSMGRDPRTITEELVRHLRNAFLSLLAPELVVLPSDRIDTIADQAQQLGAAAIVRAIERLGSALVDMRHAPDPRILVEVALVQLTHDGTGTDHDALVSRIERLETTVKQLRTQGAAASAVPKDPTTGRAVLGGAARRPERSAPAVDPHAAEPQSPSPAAASSEPAETAPASDLETVPTTSPEPVAAPEAAAPVPTVAVPDAWEQTVKSQVKPLVRALYSAGSFVGNRGDTWLFSVPNEAHGSKCNEHRADVEAALSNVVGAPVTIEFVSGGSPVHEHEATSSAPTAPPDRSVAPAAPHERTAASPPAERSAEPVEPEPAPHVPEADEDVDLHELTDAPPESVKTPIDRLAEAFPGSELMSDD
ncbi:DNA polymerase III subunit gamma/tau [Ilumatobacter sp.]|uniref:DNA polymerase III subunit gamma/tau n=1 Tax=Ilumatobacter sp. TaxID=1967498 RepID=UPI003AF54640